MYIGGIMIMLDKIRKKRKDIREYGFSEVAKRAIIKLFGGNIYVERFLLYRNPRGYWEKRGGERYFKEQESAQNRSARSTFIAENLVKLKAKRILEVGCGYGKQLRSIRRLDTRVELFGVDFSSSQIIKGREYLKKDGIKNIVCADAKDLPFLDNSFDLVFTSAVILHHPSDTAEKIRNELLRVSRRYIAHNEDKGIASTRWSYDYNEIYNQMGLKVLEYCRIPCSPSPEITQFVVVEIPEEN